MHRVIFLATTTQLGTMVERKKKTNERIPCKNIIYYKILEFVLYNTGIFIDKYFYDKC